MKKSKYKILKETTHYPDDTGMSLYFIVEKRWFPWPGWYGIDSSVYWSQEAAQSEIDRIEFKNNTFTTKELI